MLDFSNGDINNITQYISVSLIATFINLVSHEKWLLEEDPEDPEENPSLSLSLTLSDHVHRRQTILPEDRQPKYED